MTQWEYAIGLLNKGLWKANGTDIADKIQITFLQKMGQAGWEMCGTPLHPMSGTTFYFKRPKP